MKSVRQVIAIASTEFRFGLRRGWPVVGTAAVGLLMSVSTLYLAAMNMEGFTQSHAAEVGASALGMAWPAFPPLALGLLPLAAAPAIALDRQFGVAELLRSLPLSGGVYLAGKILGTLAVVLLIGAVMLALHLGLHLLLIGPVNPQLYLDLTLLSGSPLFLWAPAMGVVAACAARTRRVAVTIGLMVGLFGVLVWGLLATPPASFLIEMNPVTAWIGQMMTHPPASDFVLARYGVLMQSWATAPTAWHVAGSLLVALLVLGVASTLARLWLLWKENF